MLVKFIPIPFVLFFLIVSCTSTPEIVTETVVQVVTVEMEVTRLVVEEVEVTRLVVIIDEVVDEVVVEVTRLVEVELVATPTVEPTPEPTMTATAVVTKAPDPPAAPTAEEVKPESLLEEMVTTRDQMLNFGGTIDAADLGGSSTNCVVLVNLYDEIVDAPTMDVSAEAPEVQNGYNAFQTSVSIFHEGTKDMIAHCREFVDGVISSVDIPDLQMTAARQKVNEATDILAPGIYLLGGD